MLKITETTSKDYEVSDETSYTLNTIKFSITKSFTEVANAIRRTLEDELITPSFRVSELLTNKIKYKKIPDGVISSLRTVYIGPVDSQEEKTPYKFEIDIKNNTKKTVDYFSDVIKQVSGKSKVFVFNGAQLFSLGPGEWLKAKMSINWNSNVDEDTLAINSRVFNILFKKIEPKGKTEKKVQDELMAKDSHPNYDMGFTVVDPFNTYAILAKTIHHIIRVIQSINTEEATKVSPIPFGTITHSNLVNIFIRQTYPNIDYHSSKYIHPHSTKGFLVITADNPKKVLDDSIQACIEHLRGILQSIPDISVKNNAILYKQKAKDYLF